MVVVPMGVRRKALDGALDIHRAMITCHAMYCQTRKKRLAETLFGKLIDLSKGYLV